MDKLKKVNIMKNFNWGMFLLLFLIGMFGIKQFGNPDAMVEIMDIAVYMYLFYAGWRFGGTISAHVVLGKIYPENLKDIEFDNTTETYLAMFLFVATPISLGYPDISFYYALFYTSELLLMIRVNNAKKKVEKNAK